MKLFLTMLLVVSCGRGPAGKTGKSGLNGADGKNGVDGSSCHVEFVVNGARIFCDDGSQSVVYNGQDGADGANGTDGIDGVDGVDGRDGVDGYSPVLAIIDPCGDKPGKYDEILLKTDSGIIAYLENRGKRFLANLSPGTYVTTDEQACNFKVNADNTITEL
jgi:hypothetical protein